MTAARTFYFTPEGPGPEAAIVALITAARHSVRLAMFALTLPDLAQALIARHQVGVDVRVILDSTEALLPAEAAIIAGLRAAGVPLAVGTSADHLYMHEKCCVADGRISVYGSWNASHAASRETNHCVIDHAPSVALSFLGHWNAAWMAITGTVPPAAVTKEETDA